MTHGQIENTILVITAISSSLLVPIAIAIIRALKEIKLVKLGQVQLQETSAKGAAHSAVTNQMIAASDVSQYNQDDVDVLVSEAEDDIKAEARRIAAAAARNGGK